MVSNFKATRYKSIGAIFAFLIGFTMPLALHAAEFNDNQRKAMGQIVREYLMANPEVLRDAFQELERKETQAKADGAKAAIKTMATDIFRGDGDLVVGNPEGDVTMVEFFDYNCGYCKRSLPDILKLTETDKNLKIVVKEFPILSAGSMFAARAAIASRLQGKYWKFHLALMEKRGSIDEAAVLQVAQKVDLNMDQLKKDMKSPEVTAVIQRNHAVAQALNINGTPAFIIANDILPGAVGYQQLATTIAKVRADGSCKGLC